MSNIPNELAISQFVRLNGMRWSIETPFEQGKGEVGTDYYETRIWLVWKHPMLLTTLAHHLLV